MTTRLLQPPSMDHLARMYHELSLRGARCVGAQKDWPYVIESDLQLYVVAGLMSRYDPRLFEILINHLLEHWKGLNLYPLRQAILQSETPQIWGVLGEFVLGVHAQDEVRSYFEYLVKNMKPIEPQLFFRDLYPVGSRLAQTAASESLEEYTKWGFLGRERPTLFGVERTTIGNWSVAQRQNILRRLLTSQKIISLSDYLQEIHHTISRQQALHDLTSCAFAKPFGRGRGAGWKLNKH